MLIPSELEPRAIDGPHRPCPQWCRQQEPRQPLVFGDLAPGDACTGKEIKTVAPPKQEQQGIEVSTHPAIDAQRQR